MSGRPRKLSTSSEDIHIIVAFVCGLGSWVAVIAAPMIGHPWQSAWNSCFWGLLILGGVIAGWAKWSSAAIGWTAAALGHVFGGLIWSFTCIPPGPNPDIALFYLGLLAVPIIITGPLAMLVAAVYNSVPAKSTLPRPREQN